MIRILHIDDNLHDRLLVRDALLREHSEYEVFEADNRQAFEKYLSESQFDLILSDFNILGFDGLQVLKVVKKKTPETPVIIVTGTGSEEIAIEAIKMGASDYIIKSPNHLRGIAHTIGRVLENKKTQEERLIALAAQRESEELYRSIFDNTSVAILLAIPNGNVLSANGFACELFNMTQEELCKKGKSALVNINDSRYETLLAEMNRKGRAKAELTFIKNGGVKFPGELSIANFKNIDGQIRSSLVIRDLTEQKEAEKKLRKLSKAVEQNPTSIIITNAKGIIEFVNTKFTEEMYYTPEEVNGMSLKMYIANSKIPNYFEDMWKSLTNGKVWSEEIENVRKDHTKIFQNVVVSPIFMEDGTTISNFVILMEDITQKKIILNDLIVAKEQAEENDHLKTAFLHNVSHEIRTPMNAIVGFSSFLNDPDLPIEKRNIFTDIIIKSSEQLLSIITDIITLATVEAGQEQINVNELNLNSIFRRLYDHFLVKVEVKKLVMTYQTSLSDEDADIVTDSAKLNEILSNLIGNAVKFTDEGCIDYRYELKDGLLEFCIKDTGIGIPPEMHKEIFKRFRQIEYNSVRKFGGSGLGLSITKSYIELMGGKIWLESLPGKGSSFYFTLPYKKVSQQTLAELKEENSSNSKNRESKTVLIAEDEDSNYMLLVAMLSSLKLNIIRAVNGVEAVYACHTIPNLDLILMDLKMPELDGFQATIQIKEFSPNLPVVAQTAFTSDDEIKKVFDCGCNDFISKPINKSLLIRKVMHYLKL